MFFKNTTNKVNDAVDTANKTINEVGKSAKKILDNSNEAVSDFSNKTNAVVWTIVGCIGVTTLTNLILLAFSVRLSHQMAHSPMVNNYNRGESLRITIAGGGATK